MATQTQNGPMWKKAAKLDLQSNNDNPILRLSFNRKIRNIWLIFFAPPPKKTLDFFAKYKKTSSFLAAINFCSNIHLGTPNPLKVSFSAAFKDLTLSPETIYFKSKTGVELRK